VSRLLTRAFASKPGLSSIHGIDEVVSDPVGRLIYTETDEAPSLATYSLLPIFKTFAGISKVNVVPSDISLSGRILSQFDER